MILPSSSHNSEEQTLPPPSYQESVPPSQTLPSERPIASLYAPSIPSSPGPSYWRERELAPRLNPLDEKNPSVKFPEPRFPTGRTYSEQPLPPAKGNEKDGMKESPAQRTLDIFSSMIWGTTSTASTASRSPNPAGNSSTTQDPLNPAPSAFTRPTPKNYAYLPFQPMTMISISSDLADGFPIIPPPINHEDERQVGKANPQHAFVSHDVTEDDWVKFLIGLKTVASSPNQTQKSFLARMFLGEMNERDRRKRAVHYVDSWNHYFFQPRRMTVVLARGRRIFSGASTRLHRRHSIGYERGRGTKSTKTKGHRRSHSTDSSSSDSSISSSDSSVHSTTSQPHEMPVPHTQADGGLPHGFRGPNPGMGGGCGRGGRGHQGPFHHGWHAGSGDRGWCPPVALGLRSALTVPGLGSVLGHGGSGGSHSYRDEKRAWKAEKRAWKYEKRAIKREHRWNKRAIRHERRQRRWEAKAMRHGEKHTHRRDQPWKLIVSFHATRSDS